MVTKGKEKTEANKNYLLAHLAKLSLVELLFNEIGPVLKQYPGGYTRVTNLSQRQSDGAEMARLSWAYPVVTKQMKKLEKKKTPVGPKAEPKAEAPKTKEA